ncbi:hypothetical protein QUF50_01470 [Thiotrichales bacterium HSG1]|nr:hypothetical protein [Thiotrichales bacterium HSG1]
MTDKFDNILTILEHYHLNYEIAEFINFDEVKLVSVMDWFKDELDFSLKNRGEDDKEAFAAEFIVVPFLKEIWRKHSQLNLFSHVQIKTDDVVVIPDYLVTAKTPTGYKKVYKPLLLTVEAKNENFDEGWKQALLQSVVCQKLNDSVDIPILSIVTTGDIWQFGKLEKNLFIRHPISAGVQHVEELLGILDLFFSECEQNLEH